MCVSRRAPLLPHCSLATLLPVATIATLWLYGSTCDVQYSMQYSRLTLTAGMLCLLRETLSLGHEDTEPEPEPESEPSL